MSKCLGDNKNQESTLKTCHSFYDSQSPKDSSTSRNSWKSEINLLAAPQNNTDVSSTECAVGSIKGSGEYYKKYEHDEIPVKDYSHKNGSSGDEKLLDCHDSFTNSDLEKLERKVYQNLSQELQTNDSSLSSLDSNIRFFKITVQQIFDSFYKNMRDFEIYKEKFNEIISKNREDSVADMEDFIKDMIQHILSSESVSNNSHNVTEVSTLEVEDKDTNISTARSEHSTGTNLTASANLKLQSLVESYKNENYLTDSTTDDDAKVKRKHKKEDILNIILLSGNRHYVEIKMNDRSLLSEINIKDVATYDETRGPVASAEDLKRLAVKRAELENYEKRWQDNHMIDRDIPVKISSAKKDLHMNKDFTQDEDKNDLKSFISKICNYLCKRFRKSTFG